MKVVTRERYGGPEVLNVAEAGVPEPGPGGLRVRVMASSVNAGDRHLLRGTPFPARLAFGLRRPRLKVLGMDFAGVVTACGSGAGDFPVGSEVFGDVSDNGFGAYAEELLVPAGIVAAKPANVTFEEAAAAPVAGITAIQALRDKGKLRPGERVLVTGAAGGVGSLAVQIAKAWGAVVTAVTSTPNLAIVAGLGADHVIDRLRQDFRTLPERYDVIVDAAGKGNVRSAMRALAPGGRYVFVGGDDRSTITALLAGRAMLSRSNRDDMHELARLLKEGRLRPLVGARYPLDRVAEALRAFENGKPAGKLVITTDALVGA